MHRRGGLHQGCLLIAKVIGHSNQTDGSTSYHGRRVEQACSLKIIDLSFSPDTHPWPRRLFGKQVPALFPEHTMVSLQFSTMSKYYQLTGDLGEGIHIGCYCIESLEANGDRSLTGMTLTVKRAAGNRRFIRFPCLRTTSPNATSCPGTLSTPCN
jgi:hypothetical protein